MDLNYNPPPRQNSVSSQKVCRLISIVTVATLILIIGAILLSSSFNSSTKKMFKPRYKAFGGDCGCSAGLM